MSVGGAMPAPKVLWFRPSCMFPHKTRSQGTALRHKSFFSKFLRPFVDFTYVEPINL